MTYCQSELHISVIAVQMSFHFSKSWAVDEKGAAAKSEEMNAKDPCTVGRGGDLRDIRGGVLIQNGGDLSEVPDVVWSEL